MAPTAVSKSGSGVVAARCTAREAKLLALRLRDIGFGSTIHDHSTTASVGVGSMAQSDHRRMTDSNTTRTLAVESISCTNVT